MNVLEALLFRFSSSDFQGIKKSMGNIHDLMFFANVCALKRNASKKKLINLQVQKFL